MSGRVLPQRELNRALLARQLLLERQRLEVAQAVERICAIQGQWSPSPYIALWSRLEGFEREELTRAFAERQVVKATLMRITLHVLSSRDFLALAPLWQAHRRDEFARRGGDADAVASRIGAALADEPRTHADLYKAFPDTYNWRARSLLALVHVPPSGTWRYHGPTHLTTAESWLRQPLGPPAAGAELLVERYLAAFGPASQGDLLRFAGLRVKEVKAGMDALAPRLVRYRGEDGRVLLDLEGAPLPPAETPAPVRFLPKWDSAILAYDRRARILPAAYAKTVIHKNGDVIPTFLVDGAVAGSWEIARRREVAALQLTPFEKLPRRVERELIAEGERLARWIEDDATAFEVGWTTVS
ncbi:winged helix DNA-binding domain-containing protein [soil metagenome]